MPSSYTASRRIAGFPPIAAADARILILGSMPGVASLQAAQYYAHPHNAFWRIMGELIGFDPVQPYGERVVALQVAHVAVWDVLQSCVREGSLDTAIEHDTIVANDFADFFTRHPQIGQVFFNGGTAETCYRRYIAAAVDRPLQLTRLPSTSPANASYSFARKLDAWRAIMEPL